MIWREIAQLWATGTPTQRFRLATLLLMFAALGVMAIDLIEAAWLALAEVSAQAIRDALP